MRAVDARRRTVAGMCTPVADELDFDPEEELPPFWD